MTNLQYDTPEGPYIASEGQSGGEVMQSRRGGK